MAEYSQFLGCRVTVRYRVGEMLLCATGTFSGDSGRSIFLEQHLEQRGRKYFRWEIPYPYIHRIEAETSLDQAGSEPLPVDPIKKAAAASAGDSRARSASLPSFWNPRPAD